MKKLFYLGLLSLFPSLLFAESSGSLNFTPPPSDYSVVFLGNIFGVVDGVLHGTGSQIMGQMFGIFNAAVLSVGGVLLLYTLLVSTLNSAHQGQAFGQSWSSLWTPLRATIGIGLLIPKASGYCLMQIFVMWLVLQGVGAADKVWNAALDYLQRGGIIIQPSEGSAAVTSSASNDILNAGAYILTGQVCMLALQQSIQQQWDTAQNDDGRCSQPDAKSDTSSFLYKFCNSTVPNFINSVDIYGAQSAATGGGTSSTTQSSQCVINGTPMKGDVSVCMPNFTYADTDPLAIYNQLNGICGGISWSLVANASSTATSLNLSASETQTMEDSRAIAVMQMFTDLQSVATSMVYNDPSFSSGASSNPAYPQAIQPYGVPMTVNMNSTCSNSASDPDTACSYWNTTKSGYAPLLNGTELQGAVLDYNGLMQATLNATNNTDNVANATKFISGAKSQGWIMAGSYFFDLAMLNQSVASSQTDTTSGLENSKVFQISNLQGSFTSTNGSCQSGKPFYSLCNDFLDKKVTVLNNILTLLYGTSGASGAGDQLPVIPTTVPPTASILDQNASTVFGYNNNSTRVILPGQPGVSAAKQTPDLTFNAMTPFQLSNKQISGGMWGIPGDAATMVYNNIIKWVLNKFLEMGSKVINQVVIALLTPFISTIGAIFYAAVSMLNENPQTNPIIALANMGNYYLNAVTTLYITGGAFAALFGNIPYVGEAVITLMMFLVPLILCWTAMLWGIGVLTAYYIPFLPYMIFTFAAIGWLISVIEAMVAAPIVALGITHPEGHDAFGKSDRAVMLLLNVFLRPSMMIIGFITAISLSYVGVWVMNAGFYHAVESMQEGIKSTSWSAVFAFFFLILIYTGMYMAIVTKAFELIHVLPDKITRWLTGGEQESFGGDAARMKDDVKGEVSQAGQGVQKGMSHGISNLKKKQKKDKKGDSGAKAKKTDNNEDDPGGGDIK